MEWDVFISHASEDKEGFVRPLANRLQEQGLRVWFDEFTLTIGDSLRRSIDRGLANSRYGIVVVSPDFLKKEWPQKELDGLVAREVEGVKVILPVWHNMGAADIAAYSPTLADRVAVSSVRGLDHVTDQLLTAVRHRSPAGGPLHAVPATAVAAASPTQAQEASAQHRQLGNYAFELHSRHVVQLAAGKGPIAVLDGGALVMHVVPFSAVDNRSTDAFEEISGNPHRFPPMSGSYARDCRISYDGLFVGSNAEGLSKPQRAYVSVSRSGVVEAVEASVACGAEHNLLLLPQIQATIIKYAYVYSRTLSEFLVSPPFAVCISLIDVQDMKLLQDYIPHGAIPEDLQCGYLDRNELDFGQVIFDTLPRSYNESAKALRPILTHLANAAGLRSSPYFDAVGDYVLVDRL